MTSTPAPRHHDVVRTVRVSWTSALLAIGGLVVIIAARSAFVAAHRVLSWAVACAAVAVFLAPIIEGLSRFVPRIVAVLGTFLVIAGVAVGLIFGTVDNLDREVASLQQSLPEAVQRIESRTDSVGRFATDLDLSKRSESFLAELDDRVGSGTGTLAENAPSAPVYFVCAILTIFFLVYGPKMAVSGITQISDRRRRRLVARVFRESTQRARRTMSALLMQGTVVGLMVWGVAHGFSLPAPIVLGLLAGVMAMLPDVGIVLGALPTVALLIAFETLMVGGLFVAVLLALQLVEALVIRRRIRRFGVDVGPAVVWIVALVGYTIYGPGMAFFGVAYAMVVLAVIDQVPVAREELGEAINAPTEHSPA